MSGGELKYSVDHPTRDGEQLYLLFDFTHNFQNIFNNFLAREKMHLPAKDFETLFGKSCMAQFSQIKHLYALEEDKLLKISFALKKVSLNPSSLACTSPQHALG